MLVWQEEGQQFSEQELGEQDEHVDGVEHDSFTIRYQVNRQEYEGAEMERVR